LTLFIIQRGRLEGELADLLESCFYVKDLAEVTVLGLERSEACLLLALHLILNVIVHIFLLLVDGEGIVCLIDPQLGLPGLQINFNVHLAVDFFSAFFLDIEHL